MLEISNKKLKTCFYLLRSTQSAYAQVCKNGDQIILNLRDHTHYDRYDYSHFHIEGKIVLKINFQQLKFPNCREFIYTRT